MQHVPQALAWVAQPLGKARGELVVAPETAVPLLPEQLAELVPDYWPALRARFESSGQAALIGVPLGDYTQRLHQLGARPLGRHAAAASPTATTRCTWCPSANSSRRAFAGSPS